MSPYETVEELAQLRRLLTLRQDEARLRRDQGLLFYNPHKKQKKFHAMAHKRYRYARTGNRFGKSEMGAAEDCAHALGERIWIPKGDPMRTAGIADYPTKGLIIVIDWPKSTEIFTNLDEAAKGKLFTMLPSESIKGIGRNHSGAIDKITVGRVQGRGESIIQIDTIKSFKQSPLSSESSSFDWIHIDEPCPREMFVANARGLVDRGGKVWFTCTPLTEMWINDMFVPSRRLQVSDDLPYLEVEDKFMLVGSIYDNPYLSKEDIDAYEGLLTEDEKTCRLFGKPFAMAGLVYKEFDWDSHTLSHVPYGWEAFDIPPKDYCIRYAVDPHPKKPHAVLFVATSPQGHQYFYHEIYNPCLIPELSEQINARIKDRDVMLSIVDPIANTPNPVDGTTMMTEFENNGVFLEEATKDLSTGILKVREFLRARDEKGHPYFHVSPHLIRTLFEFDHYLWDGEKDKPVKKHDDMMENLYRLCNSGLEYIKPDFGREAKIIRPTEILDDTIDSVEDIINEMSDVELFDRVAKKKPFAGRLGKKRYVTNDVY